MTDRELLEFAAKAAGYKVNSDGFGGFTVPTRRGACREWNPLSDNGDAFMLATDLKMRVMQRPLDECVTVFAGDMFGTVMTRERYKCDNYSAVRIAIVRAAAEIGRDM